MRTRSFKSSSIMAWIGVKRDQEKSLKMYYYICLRVATRRNVIDICKFVDDYANSWHRSKKSTIYIYWKWDCWKFWDWFHSRRRIHFKIGIINRKIKDVILFLFLLLYYILKNMGWKHLYEKWNISFIFFTFFYWIRQTIFTPSNLFFY